MCVPDTRTLPRLSGPQRSRRPDPRDLRRQPRASLHQPGPRGDRAARAHRAAVHRRGAPRRARVPARPRAAGRGRWLGRPALQRPLRRAPGRPGARASGRRAAPGSRATTTPRCCCPSRSRVWPWPSTAARWNAAPRGTCPSDSCPWTTSKPPPVRPSPLLATHRPVTSRRSRPSTITRAPPPTGAGPAVSGPGRNGRRPGRRPHDDSLHPNGMAPNQPLRLVPRPRRAALQAPRAQHGAPTERWNVTLDSELAVLHVGSIRRCRRGAAQIHRPSLRRSTLSCRPRTA